MWDSILAGQVRLLSFAHHMGFRYYGCSSLSFFILTILDLHVQLTRDLRKELQSIWTTYCLRKFISIWGADRDYTYFNILQSYLRIPVCNQFQVYHGGCLWGPVFCYGSSERTRYDGLAQILPNYRLHPPRRLVLPDTDSEMADHVVVTVKICC